MTDTKLDKPSFLKRYGLAIIFVVILVTNTIADILLNKGIINDQWFERILMIEYLVVAIPLTWYLRNYAFKSRLLMVVVLIGLTILTYFFAQSMFLPVVLVTIFGGAVLLSKEVAIW